MPTLQGASDFEISGGQFTEFRDIHGSVYLGQRPDSEQALEKLQKLVEKDSALNEYSPANKTLKLPVFSKDLLLDIDEVAPDTGRVASGSCSFDLAWRLGLLPGQPNAGFTEYDQEIPLTEVVTRNTCCCGRISRHGFVFLVSRYFQHATTAEIPGIGTCIILSTTIGRFKCYEIDDRIFVHFDAATRSSQISDLVENQSLDQILRGARGQYFILDPDEELKSFVWHNRGNNTLEFLATGNLFGIPDAVMYMTKETITLWKKVNEFSKALMEVVQRFIDAIKEPETFVTAFDERKVNIATTTETTAQCLALCAYLCRLLSKKVITEITSEFYHDFALKSMVTLHQAHQHYRSPLADSNKMFTTSRDRYLKMFRQFRAQDNMAGRTPESHALIDRELQSLVSTKNNIALVVYQAFLAMTAIWNSAWVLARSREVPEDWIRFVSAEDDFIFLG